MLTTQVFLAGLPAALGIGGYVIFQVGRSRGQGSPLLKTIVEIVKEKGGAMPALDGRLNARQVFLLVKDKPELRRRLDAKDYELLETIMRREERAHLLALGSMLIALTISLVAFLYLRSLTPKITAATLSAMPPTSVVGVSNPNTIDDLKVSWTSSGGDSAFILRLVNANSPALSIDQSVRAADHSARFEAAALRELWPEPVLGAVTAVRIEFLGQEGSSSFGPFEIQTALELMYFVDEGTVTVAALDGQNHLISHAFKSTCIAWPDQVIDGQASPESVSLSTTNGKASASFGSDFRPDAASLKCSYLGSYPIGLVRYTNLHA